MKDDICTIPVSEGFEQKEGCPLCRMRDMAEKRAVTYIMGPAMMEPDIRVQTNRLGFCHQHLVQMKKANNRLSLALMLDSHLQELEQDLFAPQKWIRPSAKKTAYRAARLEESCFICESLENGMRQMIKTVCLTYNRDKEFRRLFEEQPCFCLPHLRLLLEAAPAVMEKGRADDMTAAAKAITLRYLQELGGDVHHFCEMFDYRNATPDADWGNAKDAIERTVAFLSGREVQ